MTEQSSVKTLLFTTILVMTALPMAAAFYFADHALKTCLALGFSPQLVHVLDSAAQNLRTLRELIPVKQQQYRQQFQEVQEIKHVYTQPQLVKSSIHGSLQIYFGLGVATAVVLSVVVALLLSHRIAHSYHAAFTALIAEREKVRYLEEMSSWQEVAKILAHEIKNPLTPIEVLVTSLPRAFATKTQHEFTEHLQQTEAVVIEELNHLKNTVKKFSEFAKLPAVQLARINLGEFLLSYKQALELSFNNARIELQILSPQDKLQVAADITLLRQVINNIIRNGVEANPHQPVSFVVSVAAINDRVELSFLNDGPPVEKSIAARIFDPYVSTKNGHDNVGLGLAVVKKIVIEHCGDVSYREFLEHPMFTISLPRSP